MRLFLVLSLIVAMTSILSAQDRELVALAKDSANLLRPDAWHSIGANPADFRDGILTCDNGSASPPQGGFSQTIQLNQDRPRAIIAQAFARSSDVGGTPDSGYSLYLDILYTDGTPLWGQFEPFRTGSSPWHGATIRVLPAKPIKSVSMYLLFRQHSGKAEFRDMVLAQVASTPQGACWFDGQLVSAAPSGGASLYIRDAAANSGFVQVRNNVALGVTARTTDRGNGLVDLELSDQTGRDRALTVVYAVPAKADRWLPGPSESRAIDPQQEYLSAVRIRAGTGSLSHYPFAAVSNTADGAGAALGLDMSRPAVFRAGYAAGTGELYVAADIALTPESPRCTLGLVRFAFQGGFREALSAYMQRFPDAFAVRVKRQGLWMPFFQISKVQGWEDFGFAFKEGNDETAWDDAHDILTFRYTEPMTWWMALPKAAPRTLEAAIAQATKLAADGNPDAKAWQNSAIFNSAGAAAAQIKNEPWCDGVVWSMNSAPNIASPAANHFSTKWSQKIQDALYGPKAKGVLDGEYIDSVEGYVTDDLDYRRDHFAGMRTPLTFAPSDHRPAIYKGLIAFEYVQKISDDCHAQGKLSMANGAPARWPWIPLMLDVMGTETDWNPRGKWMPMSIEELRYRRALAGKKPYCFLMNTNFDEFPPDLVERYMERAAAFGMFPGFFSHNAAEKQYFSQPNLYNRDRPLFKKYLPIIRKLAEAGWEPITLASTTDETIVIERFGQNLWTLYNPDSKPHQFTLHFDTPPTSPPRNLLSNQPIPPTHPTLTLPPEDLAVIELP